MSRKGDPTSLNAGETDLGKLARRKTAPEIDRLMIDIEKRGANLRNDHLRIDEQMLDLFVWAAAAAATLPAAGGASLKPFVDGR